MAAGGVDEALGRVDEMRPTAAGVDVVGPAAAKPPPSGFGRGETFPAVAAVLRVAWGAPLGGNDGDDEPLGGTDPPSTWETTFSIHPSPLAPSECSSASAVGAGTAGFSPAGNTPTELASSAIQLTPLASLSSLRSSLPCSSCWPPGGGADDSPVAVSAASTFWVGVLVTPTED